MSKMARRAEVDRILAADQDLAYVVRKINEMGSPKPEEPRLVDARLVEIATRWQQLTERERNELHGLLKLMLYLDGQNKKVE